jgi:hypothetical protein
MGLLTAYNTLGNVDHTINRIPENRTDSLGSLVILYSIPEQDYSWE